MFYKAFRVNNLIIQEKDELPTVWCRGDVGKCDPFAHKSPNGYRFTKKI